MRPDLIEEDALRYAIEMSAGITREFVRTIKDSCVEAIVRGGYRITCDDVERAVTDRKNDFKRILSKKTQYIALKEVRDTKSIYIDDEDIRAEIPGLLHNLSIVEYNGDIWWDVHPVVLSILNSMDDHARK
jgi:predicted RNA-binding protein